MRSYRYNKDIVLTDEKQKKSALGGNFAKRLSFWKVSFKCIYHKMIRVCLLCDGIDFEENFFKTYPDVKKSNYVRTLRELSSSDTPFFVYEDDKLTISEKYLPYIKENKSTFLADKNNIELLVNMNVTKGE